MIFRDQAVGSGLIYRFEPEMANVVDIGAGLVNITLARI